MGRNISIVFLALAMLIALPFSFQFGVIGFLVWMLVLIMAHAATKD